MNVELMLARAEINDVLIRYAEGIDQRDFEAVRSCFTPDVESEFVGEDLAQGVDALVEYISSGVADFASSVHLVGNVVVDIVDHDTTATSHSRAIAYLVRPAGTGGALRMLMRGVRYDDEWVRRGRRWVIRRRRHTPEWSVEAPVTLFASSWGGPVPPG